MLVALKRDKKAARRFFTRALAGATSPTEVTTDRAPVYPRIVEDMLPDARHSTVKYPNNRVEADHGRLKARLGPMRGRKKDRSLRVVAHRARVHPEPAPPTLRARHRRHSS